MQFRKYSSINNSNNEKFINEIRDSIKPSDQFLCFEKIHGANFQFRLSESDGELKIQYGKRTCSITEEDVFMDYQKHIITPKLIESVTKLWNLKKSDRIETITIYGEYFGGRYPHPDFDPDSNKPVQKDIWYTMKRMFCAFDLLINDCYMNIKEANEVFKSCGIFYLEPVMEGTLDDALSFDVENFATTIPKRMGLPEITNNFAEGIIIRPNTESQTFRKHRIIIKKKKMKFSERKTVRNNVIKHKTPL
jgi:Rnl2 family RNA ligase